MTSLSDITISYASLSLAAAQVSLEAGVAAAKAIGVPMGIVAVDKAGHVVALVRMDGATAMTIEIARKKAWSSVMAGVSTADLRGFVTGDEGSTLTMPHLDSFSLITGGLPVMVDGVCVGAIGVSGASVDLDLKVAEAAVAALVS